MPLYDYKCRKCEHVEEFFFHHSEKPAEVGPCLECGGPAMKPVFTSVQLAAVMQEHYNPSVDQHVSSMRQYKDLLKRASEKHSLRTGIDCSFVPADRSALGATDEGLDTTNALRRQKGLPPVSNLS